MWGTWSPHLLATRSIHTSAGSVTWVSTSMMRNRSKIVLGMGGSFPQSGGSAPQRPRARRGPGAAWGRRCGAAPGRGTRCGSDDEGDGMADDVVVGILWPAAFDTPGFLERIGGHAKGVTVEGAHYEEEHELRTLRATERDPAVIKAQSPEVSGRLRDVLGRAEAIMALDVPVDLVELAPNLKWIQAIGAGTNQFDHAGPPGRRDPAHERGGGRRAAHRRVRDRAVARGLEEGPRARAVPARPRVGLHPGPPAERLHARHRRLRGHRHRDRQAGQGPRDEGPGDVPVVPAGHDPPAGRRALRARRPRRAPRAVRRARAVRPGDRRDGRPHRCRRARPDEAGRHLRERGPRDPRRRGGPHRVAPRAGTPAPPSST